MHSKRIILGKSLLTLVALVTTTGAFIADWNVTHIYNPNWPPHAKFHNGQTMAVAALLGLLTFYFVWRRKGDSAGNLLAAGLFGALYWVSQLAAFAFPGVSYTDPEFLKGPAAAVPPQVFISLTLLALTAAGVALVRSGNKQLNMNSHDSLPEAPTTTSKP